MTVRPLRTMTAALGSPSAAEVAAALSDPNTNLGTLNTQVDYIAYAGDIPGASSADATRMLFQPSLPYKLSDTTNLFVRPAIPVIFRQDVPQPGGGFSAEGIDLGDISFDAASAKRFRAESSCWAVWPAPYPRRPTIPWDWTSGCSVRNSPSPRWEPKVVVGILVSHQWDVAGEDDFDTSITAGQYFYTFTSRWLADKWMRRRFPTITRRPVATSGHFRWLLVLPRRHLSVVGHGNSGFNTGTMSSRRTISDPIFKFDSWPRRWLNCPGEPGV